MLRRVVDDRGAHVESRSYSEPFSTLERCRRPRGSPVRSRRHLSDGACLRRRGRVLSDQLLSEVREDLGRAACSAASRAPSLAARLELTLQREHDVLGKRGRWWRRRRGSGGAELVDILGEVHLEVRTRRVARGNHQPTKMRDELRLSRRRPVRAVR